MIDIPFLKYWQKIPTQTFYILPHLEGPLHCTTWLMTITNRLLERNSEVRTYISLAKIPILKLPRFFPHCLGDDKNGNFKIGIVSTEQCRSYIFLPLGQCFEN